MKFQYVGGSRVSRSLRKAKARKLAGLCKSLKGLKLKCLKGYRENSMAG